MREIADLILTKAHMNPCHILQYPTDGAVMHQKTSCSTVGIDYHWANNDKLPE